MSIDESIANEALARWQDILRLRDWDVRIEVVREGWRKSGDIKVDAANRLAVLLLNHTIEADAEEVILHELIHLKLHGLDRMLEDLLDSVYGSEEGDPKRAFARSVFMDRLESTTQDLTKALFAASDRKTEAVSGLLRDSVAREIGEARPESEATR
jgi:hypothetical protein